MALLGEGLPVPVAEPPWYLCYSSSTGLIITSSQLNSHPGPGESLPMSLHRLWEMTSSSTFNHAFLTPWSRLGFKGLDSALISLKPVCPLVLAGSSMGGGDFYSENQAATKQKESRSIIPSKRIKQWKQHMSLLCGIFCNFVHFSYITNMLLETRHHSQ